MQIREFQQLIEQRYSEKDRQRGSAKTFIWFVEEVGELARAIARRETDNLAGEFADVFAWLVTLANVEGVDLEKAIEKFTVKGCPGCGNQVCTCSAKMT